MNLSKTKLSVFLACSAMSAFSSELVMENVAHRGLWIEADLPQNTVEAIRAAYAAGAHMVETDFTETTSGEIICLHDRTALASMSSIVKEPRDITAEDRAKINLGEKKKLPKAYRNYFKEAYTWAEKTDDVRLFPPRKAR